MGHELNKTNLVIHRMDVKVSAPGIEKVRASMKTQQKQAKKNLNETKKAEDQVDGS